MSCIPYRQILDTCCSHPIPHLPPCPLLPTLALSPKLVILSDEFLNSKSNILLDFANFQFQYLPPLEVASYCLVVISDSGVTALAGCCIIFYAMCCMSVDVGSPHAIHLKCKELSICNLFEHYFLL